MLRSYQCEYKCIHVKLRLITHTHKYMFLYIHIHIYDKEVQGASTTTSSQKGGKYKLTNLKKTTIDFYQISYLNT
jgi:hypothetical protein